MIIIMFITLQPGYICCSSYNMKKILVPTDFSDNALKAAFYAAEIARKSGAPVCLLHVAERGNVFLYQPFPYNGTAKDENLDRLSVLVTTLSGMYADINFEMALATGKTTDAIVDFAKTNGFDWIVMGTLGASGIKQVLFGSVTANVIAEAGIPVLAIPAAYSIEEPDALLLATNHFEQDPALIGAVTELATLFSATVHVAVFEETEATRETEHLRNTQQLQQYVEYLKDTVPGVSFKAQMVQGTSFEGAIERYFINNEVDIIAMITYPQSFWARLLHQSTTQKMTFHTHAPILAIPATISKTVAHPSG
jgi:nucleotide-binding universal stress UspA family protein